MRLMSLGFALIGAILLGGPQAGFAQQGHEHGMTHGQGDGMKTMGDQAGGHADKADVPLCPVMGDPANLAVSTPTDDGPVYFCCKDCIPKYKADPAKYADKVAAQRQALASRPKVQVTCPVSGEPVDTSVFVEKDGKKVYFCCKGCVGKYEAKPEKYAAALANSYTYQTKCPVKGGDIDPQAFTTFAGGGKVYFCRQGCEDQLLAHPDEYLPNLAGQGVSMSVDEMKHRAASDKDTAHSGCAGDDGAESHGH